MQLTRWGSKVDAILSVLYSGPERDLDIAQGYLRKPERVTVDALLVTCIAVGFRPFPAFAEPSPGVSEVSRLGEQQSLSLVVEGNKSGRTINKKEG